MPRISRMVVQDQKAVYHVMSRTALSGFPFKDVDKDQFVNIIRHFSQIYFAEVLGFCIMGNHIHMLIQMNPDRYYSDKDIKERFARLYGNEAIFPDEDEADGQGNQKGLRYYRKKWSSLSSFMQEIKQTFSRYYNKRHGRRGTLWGERFKSVIVDRGETLVNCLAYIDLNPLRAGIVKRPEDYRWNSIGYHLQTGNKDHFLSTDFGLKEFNVSSEKERVRRYRRYLYEAGSIDRSDKGQTRIIDPRVVYKERKKGFKLSKASRLRYRTRYFTDSGIIGSKEFVTANYKRFKHLFISKHEKIPKPINGLSGIYSLKRLSELI